MPNEKKVVNLFCFFSFSLILVTISSCGIKGKPLPPIPQPFATPAVPAQSQEEENKTQPSVPAGKKKVSK